MSDTFRGLGMSASNNKIGPDYFGFYVCEALELLCRGKDFLPFSSEASDAGIKHEILREQTLVEDNKSVKENKGICGSAPLFSNNLEPRLPELIKERLKSLLRQSVLSLTQEVDEMLDPVFSICRIQAILRYKKSPPNTIGTACETDNGQPSQKKIKLSTSSSGDDDLQFLLENDSSEVEGILKKYYDELLMTIKYMENMLDKLLDIVMFSCRSMTLTEKQELRRLIQNLPARNLDRVVEIIQRSRPVSCTEIHVDLEKEDKVTLWRLYHYICTVESARKLCKDQ